MESFLADVSFINLAINAIILIVLIGLSEKALKRIRNIIDVLSNGSYHNCPFFEACEKQPGDNKELTIRFKSDVEGGEKL